MTKALKVRYHRPTGKALKAISIAQISSTHQTHHRRPTTTSHLSFQRPTTWRLYHLEAIRMPRGQGIWRDTEVHLEASAAEESAAPKTSRAPPTGRGDWSGLDVS